MQCLSSKARYMIVASGGKGLRMGNDIPKQFLPLCGKPVLMRTLEKIKKADNEIQLILVLPKEHQDYWFLLCKEYEFEIEHRVVIGGDERFFSVKNALDTIDDLSSIIGVHDGVRPFVSDLVIKKCFNEAEISGNAIPAINPLETVRIKDKERLDNRTRTFDRNSIWLVQTPQCFDAKLLKEAYCQDYNKGFTDDASVVESIGYSINLVEGNRENIKITNPLDIAYAEILIDEFKD